MILEIKSTKNSHYKKLKKLIKEQKDFIVIEGEKLLRETVNSFIEVDSIYIDKKNVHLVSKIFGSRNQIKVVYVERDLLANIYTTDTKPTRGDLVIAIAIKPDYKLDGILQGKKDLIFLESVQDPGNVGAVIRSALAFNIGGLFLSDGSVYPYNTKVVRSSAGALFKIPVCTTSDADGFFYNLKKRGYKIIATSKTGRGNFEYLKEEAPCIFLFGSEGKGLSAKTLKHADLCIQIPTSCQVESLNISVAASIILWERYKFRSQGIVVRG